MTRAISSGLGHFAKSAFGIALRFAAVSIMLGIIEFAQTPVPFKSWARQSIIATAADFEAEYADAPAAWSTAAFDATFTIAPLPCFTITRAAALASTKPARKFS